MASAFTAPKATIKATKPTLPPTQEKPSANPYGLSPDVAPYVIPQLNLIDQQEAAQRQKIGDYTKAVLAQLAGFAPAIGSDYDTAIKQSQALAQAGADTLRQANGNGGIQSILQSAGAPDSQQQQISSHLGSVFNGGAAALFGTRGEFPGQKLISDKAANQAFANQLPGINALAGQGALANLLSQEALARQKVLAGVPSILGDIAKQKATQAYQNAQLGLSQERVNLTAQNQKRQAANDAFGEWAKTQSLKQGAQRLNNQQAAQSFNQWAKQQGLKVQWANVDLSNRRLVLSQQKASRTKVSAAAMSSARSFLFANKRGYWADPNDPETVLTTSQANAIRSRGGQVSYTNVPPKGHDADIQRIYETLVQKYGIPARQAFNMVANQYRVWGSHNRANYFPKADAAQGAASAKARAVVESTTQYLGTPYAWGGESPGGFDCSGLLQYVWGKQGVNIPRTTYDQWTAGKSVPKGRLQPGDAVFFTGSDPKGGKPGHVGMYVGNGKFIEAPHTGASVRVSNLAGRSDYVGARRYG